MRIHPEVERLRDLASNQYLILDAGNLTLIDTGLAGNARSILRTLGSLGFAPTALKTILITHADGDHYGALRELVKLTRAQVFAGQIEAEAMRIGGSSRPLQPRGQLQRLLLRATGRLFRAGAVEPITVIRSGTELPIWGGLQVLDTRGHTPGHLSFFHAPSRTLFCGDSIWISAGNLCPSRGINCWDETLALQAFESQMGLKPARICGGHFYRMM